MASWKKINIHLQRYWAREVLGKFPVMQHLRFGTIFPMTWEPTVDKSRMQLQYVSGRAHSPQEEVVERKHQSHMSKGNKDEFTSIRTVY